MDKYDDLPMDFCDASLVHLASSLKIHRIATIDVRDFSVYRLAGNKRFVHVLDEQASSVKRESILLSPFLSRGREGHCSPSLCFFQPVVMTWGFAKAQDGGFVRQAGQGFELGEFNVQLGVKRGHLSRPRLIG